MAFSADDDGIKKIGCLMNILLKKYSEKKSKTNVSDNVIRLMLFSSGSCDYKIQCTRAYDI